VAEKGELVASGGGGVGGLDGEGGVGAIRWGRRET